MRIVHISDFHLRHHLPGTSEVPSRCSRKMPHMLEGVVQWIGSMEDVDLIAVTGDLVDYPFKQMDDPAILEQGRQDLRLLAQLLERLPVTTAIVYGNHDHPGLFRDVFCVPPSQHVGGARVVSFFDEEGEQSVPERVGKQRRNFDELLGDGDALPVIHLQHYLTAPVRDDGWPHTYRDGEIMCDQLISDSRYHLVLQGHYHPGITPFCAGGRAWFSTVPAFCEPPHVFRVYDLALEGELRWQQHEFNTVVAA
ncbi:MAG: metallophosphoesterase [Candidatus Latescibacterota bacterium]|nr:metallophosphoesterase [Candidatus Latescibacterota bacterium]